MILLSKQNPGENEEHFVFQDPDHRYRRAVVKQELADVRRSHRFDVHRNAHERRRSKFNKTSARSSVEKLSIESIFNVHTVLAPLPATMLRVNPELYETKFGTRAQKQGSISPCRPTSFVFILFSGRTSQLCSTADDHALTHAEHVIEDSAELSTHKSL